MFGACTPRAAVPLTQFAGRRPKLANHHRFPKLPFSSTTKPPHRLAIRRHNSSPTQYQEFQFDLPDDDGAAEEYDCPWEGAISYRRNAAVSHVEYGTTLERLGLGKAASELSRTRAFELGLRVVGPNKGGGDSGGTPVVVSVDVTRMKGKLRLDGVVRTVLALSCNSCGEPTTQTVFTNFALLLSEEPVKEPETIYMGTIFGQYKSKARNEEEEEYDDSSLIDPEDHLYFPMEQKTIDISKNVRDLIHVEITMDASCGPHCKGMCLECGANLNNGRCSCANSKVEDGVGGYGPLRGLRKQMQRI